MFNLLTKKNIYLVVKFPSYSELIIFELKYASQWLNSWWVMKHLKLKRKLRKSMSCFTCRVNNIFTNPVLTINALIFSPFIFSVSLVEICRKNQLCKSFNNPYSVSDILCS